MQQQDQPCPFGLDDARAFIAAAEWVLAKNYGGPAAHEYCTRWTARARGIEREFEAFAKKIRLEGYWRTWSRWEWRTLDVPPHFYWLHHNPVSSVRERTVINRWVLAAKGAEPAQLRLDVEGLR
jgi:hypothetical protein